jgi:hypothetical protein
MKYPESMIRITQCIRCNGPGGFGTYNLNPSAGRAGVAHLRRPTRPRVAHAV